jgi:hypothetical protein
LLFPYRFVSKKTLNYLGNKPSIEYYNEITLNEYENEEEILDLKQKTINYCLKDVEITYNFLLNIKKVLKEVGTSLLSNSYSAPSIAIKVFFKKFNSMKIEPKIKLVEEKYIRNSYFGGRTEVFGNPKSGELIHYFDFSGMYGQCMLEKFPIQIKEFKFENLNLSEIGFHTIEYESDSYIPILPTKNNFDSKLMFKNGKQKGTY